MMMNNMIVQQEMLPDESDPMMTNASADLPPMTLTVEDLQRELHISRNTAYELTERKGFPVIRIGKRKLINRAKLQEWLDGQVA